MTEASRTFDLKGIAALGARVVLFGGALFLLVTIVTGQGGMLEKGGPAPPLHLTSYDGKHWDLSVFEGRPVVVNFWATWCPPCMAELPHFARTAQERDDVVLVGVAVQSPPQEVFDTLRRLDIRYPIATSDAHSLEAWQAQTLPTTYVLDDKHRVVWAARGQLTKSQLDDAIAEVVPAP